MIAFIRAYSIEPAGNDPCFDITVKACTRDLSVTCEISHAIASLHRLLVPVLLS
jgi:hypothetical protein